VFHIRVHRVHQQGDAVSLRNQFGKQLDPLGDQFDGQHADTGEVAAWPG
jgi:hypothetical protein